mgnify:FL=1
MKNYQPCDIILVQRPIRSLDLIPLAIQIGTLCRWNHMGLAISDKEIIHSHGKDKTGKSGVSIDFIDSIEGRKLILRYIDLTSSVEKKIIFHALKQKDKKFNWWTFFGKSDTEKNKLSCQDIVNDSFSFAGIELNYWRPRDFLYDDRFVTIKGGE